jgi:hypothetical protein
MDQAGAQTLTWEIPHLIQTKLRKLIIFVID